jgi:hypothetical protein
VVHTVPRSNMSLDEVDDISWVTCRIASLGGHCLLYPNLRSIRLIRWAWAAPGLAALLCASATCRLGSACGLMTLVELDTSRDNRRGDIGPLQSPLRPSVAGRASRHVGEGGPRRQWVHCDDATYASRIRRSERSGARPPSLFQHSHMFARWCRPGTHAAFAATVSQTL